MGITKLRAVVGKSKKPKPSLTAQEIEKLTEQAHQKAGLEITKEMARRFFEQKNKESA
jgi:hypothetical protein